MEMEDVLKRVDTLEDLVSKANGCINQFNQYFAEIFKFQTEMINFQMKHIMPLVTKQKFPD